MLESASNRLLAGIFLGWHLEGFGLAFLPGGHPTAPPVRRLSVTTQHDEQRSNAGVDTKWLYTHRGATLGPVSSTDLRAAAHLGFLGPDVMVCHTADGIWIRARSIQGLFKEAT